MSTPGPGHPHRGVDIHTEGGHPRRGLDIHSREWTLEEEEKSPHWFGYPHPFFITEYEDSKN